jgi:hypothetical protein
MLPAGPSWVKPRQQHFFAWLNVQAVPLAVVSRLDEGPFLLHHPDLSQSNIIVDEEFKIVGLVDWSWASTVPVQSFTMFRAPSFSEFHLGNFEMSFVMLTKLSDYVAQNLPHTILWMTQIRQRAEDVTRILGIRSATSISSDYSEGEVTTRPPSIFRFPLIRVDKR